MRTDLYRHYDGKGRLLYVGVSWSALRRYAAHASSRAAWVDDIRRIDIEPFESREEALAAERNAIWTEGPLFNIKGTLKAKRRTDTRPVHWWEWSARHPDFWDGFEFQDDDKFTTVWCGHLAAAGCLDAPL